LLESVTVTWKLYEPAAVGVPLMVVNDVVEEPSVRPGGRVPPLSVQVNGARPPDAFTCAVYRLPTLAGNSSVGSMTGVPNTSSNAVATYAVGDEPKDRRDGASNTGRRRVSHGVLVILLTCPRRQSADPALVGSAVTVADKINWAPCCTRVVPVELLRRHHQVRSTLQVSPNFRCRPPGSGGCR
jgi:hypothetical protein